MITYKYKVYTNKKNSNLHNQINVGGLIYNHFIAIHKRYYRFYKKYPSKFKLMRHLTKLRNSSDPKYSYFKRLNSQASQDIIDRIDKGYIRFFKKQAKRPPTFRKVCKAKSFTLTQTGYKLERLSNKIIINKISYKYSKSREIKGNVKTVTIKRDTLNDLYLFIVTDHTECLNSENKTMSGKMVGFDFGLKTFLTSSDGKDIENPEFLREFLNKKRKLDKAVSTKRKGSNNQKRAKLSVAHLSRHIANKRLDWQFKLAKKLCNEYSYIFIETLDIGSMVSKKLNRHWGRKINDLAVAQFYNILEYQASKTGTTVHKIDKWYPSSKTCSMCGHKRPILQLSDREWLCTNCKTILNRDRNASLNILREGASSLGLDSVRLDCSSAIVSYPRIPVL